MAKVKTIVIPYETGKDLYAMVKRDLDGYFLATDCASFANTSGYPVFTEDTVMFGSYTMSTTVTTWDDGLYTVAAYEQTGAAPAPVSDYLLGVSAMRIFGDSEVDALVDMGTVGAGAVSVDHDYGTAGALKYLTDGGSGIDNADVMAFLTSDYDAGNRTSGYIRAQTTTDVNGEWVLPMYLDPGDYTMVFIKQGYYGPDTVEVTVT